MTLNKLALNNVLRDKWTYFAYFLSSTFSVITFFMFSVSMFHPDLNIIQSGSALFMAMMAGNILVYMFSFVFISYSVMAFMKSRQKTLALFTIMGASKKQLNKMIFKENMIIGVAAIITAILIGLVFSPLSLLAARRIMSVEGFAMYFPLKAVLLTFSMFFILFLAVALICPIFIRKSAIIQMLKSEKRSDKEIKFSLTHLVIAIIIILATIFVVKVPIFKSFIESTCGPFIILLLLMLALNILYKQISVIIFNKIKKSSVYYKRTNMLAVADANSKMRTNVKIMYIITILFTGAFYAIVMLYAARADVEAWTKRCMPFNYTYISKDSNVYEKQHINLIRSILKKEKKYMENKFSVMSNKELGREGFISQKVYNDIIKIIGGKPISLKSNEAYVVIGSRGNEIEKDINLSEEAVLEKQGIKAEVINISSRSITPDGYFNRIYVLNNDIFNKMNKKEFKILNIYVFNIDNWKENLKADAELGEKIPIDEEHRYSFFSAGETFNVESTGKNLTLYIGFTLSMIFIIAAIAIIYFKLITDIEKECVKFKGIVKIGLSNKELSKIICTQLSIIMFIPFFVSIALLFIGAISLGGVYIKVALLCFGIFLVIQGIGYSIVNSKYRKAIFKKIGVI